MYNPANPSGILGNPSRALGGDLMGLGLSGLADGGALVSRNNPKGVLSRA